MPDPRWIVGVTIALLIAGTIFFVPIGKVDVPIIEYTTEPLKYDTQHIQDRQVSRYLFWKATEIQYLVTNNDSVDGTFTLNYVFSNGEETKSLTKKLEILAGAQEAVAQVSPLNGVSSASFKVIPSNKTVAHRGTVSKDITLWDRIWDLKAIFGIK
jgi:hypothetical protein